MSILSSVGAGKRLVSTRVKDMFYALTKISEFIKENYDYAPIIDDAGTKCFGYRLYFTVHLKEKAAEKEKPAFTLLYPKGPETFSVDMQQKITGEYEHKKNEILWNYINNKQTGTNFDIEAELRRFRFEETLKALTKTFRVILLSHGIKTDDIEYISILDVNTNNAEKEQELRADVPTDYSMYRDRKLAERYSSVIYQQLITSYSYICL